MNLEKKHIAIIAIVVIIIAIVAAYAFGYFDFSEKTEFDNKFISGTFTGNITKNPMDSSLDHSEWADSYIDKVNSIEYNMSCVKNGSILMDLYSIQGLGKPEIRDINGVSWNIYYSQAVPTTNANSINNSSVMNVYICQADNNGASVIIYIVSSSDKIKCDGSLYCDLYKNYVESLLKSISFKDNSNAPELHEVLGLQKSDIPKVVEEIKQVKSNPNFMY